MCGAEKVRHMLMGEQVLKKWKKSKKMTVAFGGILVMSVVIGGCGGREDAKKSIKIGISVYDQYDTFVSEMMKDFNDYATKKEEETGVAINIDTYNASASQSTQNSQVENMITEGCDVICVNLVDRTDPTAIIDLAEKNNIPVIFPAAADENSEIQIQCCSVLHLPAPGLCKPEHPDRKAHNSRWLADLSIR